MAITRTQIAKQLLEQGGRVGLKGGGADMGTVGTPDSPARDNREIGQRQARTEAAARAITKSMAQFGDPDPEVDVPTNQRADTATSFLRNLDAERRSNPTKAALSLINPIFGIPTLLSIARKTGKVRDELGLTYNNDEDDDTGGDNGTRADPFLPMPQPASTPVVDDYYANVGGDPFADRKAYRFLNEGGMADETVGGIMDLESSRQMYGLGKLVKKVTRSVKKIAKSDIGKAALLYAGGAYLGGSTALGGAGGSFMSRLAQPSNLMNLKNVFSAKGLPSFLTGPRELGVTTRGLFSGFPGGKFGAGILASSALAGLMTPKQDEDEDEEFERGEGIDIAKIRSNPFEYTAPRFMAEGGSTDKEPVAKKVMPLLDMDGQEKDYRETGGFVDMGRMEKADDVPARLSKNEFVFTADAVRNAGDGSVDKGAEVMYNMMKNLESGGDVSEESQGLEGARDMFKTSQRLEEVL